MSVKIDGNYFIIKTQNAKLILREFCGYLESLYFGASISDYKLNHLSDDQIYGFCPYDENFGLRYIYQTRKYEYSGANTGDYRIAALNIADSGGFIGCRLKFAGAELVRKIPEKYTLPTIRNLAEGLKITLKDEQKKISASLYYFPVEECDVICRFTEIFNYGETKIELTKAASLQTDLGEKDFEILYYDGVSGGEMRLNREPLPYGKFDLSSGCGFTGHGYNPFFALCSKGANEDSGECYGFNLLYSGNFKNCIEKTSRGNVRVTSGIGEENFRFSLGAGERFFTPQAVMCYSENGLGNLSRNFHRLIRQCLIPALQSGKYPIVVNTWESCDFDISAEKLYALADKALEIGADTLVLDDGWFRNDDKSGLGDWQPLHKKFPDGFGACIQKITQKGLSFGIWFEPEMVSKNSDLFRFHPEWVLNNGDFASESRNQLVLDMCNPNVTDYLIATLCGYLQKYPISYIKWDANRYLSEAGSAYLKEKNIGQGELWHRYVLGVYRVLGEIRKRFPNVVIEGCAGGGGRFDLGMLYFQPLIWISDNTDPFARAKMQYEASFAYPLCVMSYHISENTGYYGKNADADFRYIVSEIGGFGYEFDITKLDQAETARYHAITEKRREREKFITQGDLYRLNVNNAYYFATAQVSRDKKEALLTFIQTNAQIYNESAVVKLAGLDETALYEQKDYHIKLHGKTLEKAGIRIADLICPHWKDKNRLALQKGRDGSGISMIFKLCAD